MIYLIITVKDSKECFVTSLETFNENAKPNGKFTDNSIITINKFTDLAVNNVVVNDDFKIIIRKATDEEIVDIIGLKRFREEIKKEALIV